jgi:hypothetical protein
MRATERKHEMGKRFAIVIGVAAAGVMALGAQTASSTTGDSVDSTPPDLQLSATKKQYKAIGARTDCGRVGAPYICGPSCDRDHAQTPAASVSGDASHCEIVVKASCGDEACTARAEGKLTKVKHEQLVGMGSADLAPRETTAGVSLYVTKKTRKKAGRALDDGKNVEAKVTVRAKDAAGNVATEKITIRLAVDPGPR